MKTRIIIIAQLSLCALLISAATTAALNEVRPTQLFENTHSELLRLTSIRPDRIASDAPSMDSFELGHTSKGQNYSDKHADKNLKLQAEIADSLGVADQHIHWTISQQGEVVKHLSGNAQGLNLPAGSYTVKLSIGEYASKKQITINGKQSIQPYFKAGASRLLLRSNQTVDWVITGSDKRSYRFSAKSRLNKILPADIYTVSAVFRDLTLSEEVQIRPGQQLKAAVDVPMGKVKLIATRNNQPLFKPVVWDVFRLANNQRQAVGKYRLHARSISMPPGHYEAVVKHENTIGKRRFWVRESTVNNVILALD